MPKVKRNNGFLLFDCIDAFFISDKTFSGYQQILGFASCLPKKRKNALAASDGTKVCKPVKRRMPVTPKLVLEESN